MSDELFAQKGSFLWRSWMQIVKGKESQWCVHISITQKDLHTPPSHYTYTQAVHINYTQPNSLKRVQIKNSLRKPRFLLLFWSKSNIFVNQKQCASSSTYPRHYSQLIFLMTCSFSPRLPLPVYNTPEYIPCEDF